MFSFKSVLQKVVVFTPPIFLWMLVIRTYKKLYDDLKIAKLHHDRHNCLVTFSVERGITGWPDPKKSNKILPPVYAYEPFLYFIQTTTISLDVAVMSIESLTLIQALIEAHKRGVKVRILVDLDYCNKAFMLSNAGLSVTYYVAKERSCSIMHYKFAVKDHEDEGAVCFGSLNWTSSAIQLSYDAVIFSTDADNVKTFHDQFEYARTYINNINNNDIRIKTVLKDFL